ncbi:DNA gyrase inhibitor YacG [Octadecabacter sp. 1_MG-2023]|uniref:DNA gyrase inhibitor YacG n=1 Tax=Octadecabacter TaxID=53945 RepID=UPI001C087410|nr:MULTISPECIES: DNA gyrase inhibitor YacG [Octadecabacter]MBU2993979.1 DNA gyrase inhibitor YacG [Octadecabacter sp. B2R22]MCF2905405.1 DNA gyrase inhibitor YacG [Octadecabacter algicola]MDO6735174.1 DNA gyrase inhibitor YacG [Octadecabacter sp. 1_MG-2023]
MTCPICAKDTAAEYRPFCSKRCADVDLAKWLGGDYAVPSQNPDDADDLLDALEKAAEEPNEDPDLPRLS